MNPTTPHDPAERQRQLDILRMYQPFGVRVRVVTYHDEIIEGTLDRVNELEIFLEGRSHGIAYAAAAPYLRLLTGLDTPLPDGRVALHRVAELLVQFAVGTGNFRMGTPAENAELQQEVNDGDMGAAWTWLSRTGEVMDRGRVIVGVHRGTLSFRVQSQGRYGWEDFPGFGLNQNVVQYLLENHFALRVNDQPVVWGVDFHIALLSTPPTNPEAHGVGVR